MPKVILKNLDEALLELDKIIQQPNIKHKAWRPFKIFHHCSQTINYSMEGYPVLKSILLRKTIGRFVFRKFIKQGFMKHTLNADVPGSALSNLEGTTEEGILLLKKSINRFKQHTGSLKPHVFFGDLTKKQYDQYFAMHIADHLLELDY